jgi:hypothetical protein
MPSQTISVSASGNLNSLAGQTIYAKVVDPDSLFIPGTLTVSEINSGTYATTLSGQALEVAGPLTGNLQILVSTDPTFATQLDGSPLIVPFNVTVTPAVTGTSLVTHLPFNASTGGITPATPVPNNIVVIQAILGDGTVVNGNYNAATGAYTIPTAPTTNYWLYANDSYIWTSSKVVNLGWKLGGRNAGINTEGDDVDFDLSGLAPWSTDDYLLCFDFACQRFSVPELQAVPVCRLHPGIQPPFNPFGGPVHRVRLDPRRHRLRQRRAMAGWIQLAGLQHRQHRGREPGHRL